MWRASGGGGLKQEQTTNRIFDPLEIHKTSSFFFLAGAHHFALSNIDRLIRRYIIPLPSPFPPSPIAFSIRFRQLLPLVSLLNYGNVCNISRS